VSGERPSEPLVPQPVTPAPGAEPEPEEPKVPGQDKQPSKLPSKKKPEGDTGG